MTQFFFSLFSLLIPCLAVDTIEPVTQRPAIAGMPVSQAKTLKTHVVNKGVSIAYSEAGRGTTTLLFLHGWGINRTYWVHQLKYFSKRYHVVAIDLPGFGQSGKNRKDWSVGAFAGDISATITQLHLKNVVLIGHSFTQNFIAEAALHNKQVKGLVGIDNFKGYGAPLDTAALKEVTSAIRQFKADFKGCARQFALQMGYGITERPLIHRIIYDYSNTDPVPGIAVFEQQEYFNENLQAQKLKASGRKLYLINSDATPTDVSGLKAQGIPFKLLNIHRTGHFPMIEKPQQFNLLLDSALNQIKADHI